MGLKNGNIGLAVSTLMMVVGALWVGPGATDAEIELICWPALGVGLMVVLLLHARENGRSADRPPSDGN
jgi:hypothetical protein